MDKLLSCSIVLRAYYIKDIFPTNKKKTPDEVRPLVAFVSHPLMTLDVISKGLDHEIASHSVS